jgi:hypothetical protein
MPDSQAKDGVSMPGERDGIEIKKFHKRHLAFVFTALASKRGNVNRTVVISSFEFWICIH